MKITDLCDVLDVELRVAYTPRAVGPWISNLNHSYADVFFKQDSEDVMARSATGWGKTPDESIADLVRNLNAEKYELVVVQHRGPPTSSGERYKYNMPRELTT